MPVEWIDFNGHVNDSRHFQMTSETVDRFMEGIGADDTYRAGGHSWFTVESHLRFHAQAYLGDHLRGDVVLLQHDAKRVHVLCTVWTQRDDEGRPRIEVVCTAEHLLLHVDTAVNRVVGAPSAMLERLAAVARRDATRPRPPGVPLLAFRGA